MDATLFLSPQTDEKSESLRSLALSFIICIHTCHFIKLTQKEPQTKLYTGFQRSKPKHAFPSPQPGSFWFCDASQNFETPTLLFGSSSETCHCQVARSEGWLIQRHIGIGHHQVLVLWLGWDIHLLVFSISAILWHVTRLLFFFQNFARQKLLAQCLPKAAIP